MRCIWARGWSSGKQRERPLMSKGTKATRVLYSKTKTMNRNEMTTIYQEGTPQDLWYCWEGQSHYSGDDVIGNFIS